MRSREKELSELDQQIAELQALRNTFAAFPPVDCIDLYASPFGSIVLIIPYDWRTFATVRHQIGNEWAFDRKMFIESDGRMTRHYHHTLTNAKLRIDLDSSSDKSTCRRVKVGERVEPVYEVICE